MDATSGVLEVLLIIYDIFVFSYNTLNSIVFFNITLLQFILTLNILGVIVAIFLVRVNSNALNSAREYSRSKKRGVKND